MRRIAIYRPLPAHAAKHRLLLFCVCLIALTGTQCGKDKDRASSRGSTIVILSPIDERGLGPAWDEPPKLLVFLPLVTLNTKGETEGRLAERWEHSPDYHTWTIHLREDIRWHDGVPFTAHDIKFTMDLISHPDVLLESPDAYTVTVLDNNTLTITYHQRPQHGSGPLDDYLVYYPKHLLEEMNPKDFYKWDFWKQPVGNGPYRYVRHVPKTMMELEANPDYYRGKPKIERVILKFGTSSLPELLSGNVDVLVEVNQMDLLKIGQDKRYRIYYRIYTGAVNAILWNHRHPFFRDPRVRRALTLAIDRSELLKVLNLPDQTPISDGFVTMRQFRRGELPEPLAYDPVLASQLLDKAGWHDDDGDGLCEKNGETFRFSALIPKGYQGQDKAAIFIRSQLKKVGILMEIHILDDSIVYKRLKAGDFEAVYHPLASIINHPASFYGDGSLGSRMGYQSSRVEKLLDVMLTSRDPEKIDAIYRKLQTIFQEDLPATILYPLVWTTVVHRRVHGLSTPFRTNPVGYMEHLWIEGEE